MTVSKHVRFDFRALYDALDHYRLARGAPWAQIAAETLVSRSTLVGTADAGPMELAAEIGTGANVLTALARGGRTAVPTIVWIAAWLDRPVEDLTREAAS